MKSCVNFPLLHYCLTQKGEWESCNDMLLRYNAGLLLPPEQRIGKKEQQRIKRRELHKAMRKVSPFFAWVQDNCGGYLYDL